MILTEIILETFPLFWLLSNAKVVL